MTSHILFAATSIAAALLSIVPALAEAESEEDSEIVLLMQEMDGAIEDLEPFIGAQNTAEALDTALFLQDALLWTKDHFVAKGDAADGVDFAQQGHDTAVAVARSLEANDFAAAAEGARALSGNCRTCHDAYRP
jgi:hypothetical protein